MTHEEFAAGNRQTFRVGERVKYLSYPRGEDAVITADLTYIDKNIGNLYSIHIYRSPDSGGDVDMDCLAGFLRPAPPTEP